PFSIPERLTVAYQAEDHRRGSAFRRVAHRILSLGKAFEPPVVRGIPMSMPVALAVAAAPGAGIGMASSFLGVAGGELIISALMYVFGAEIKTAGTASLIISRPTVVMGLFRHALNGVLMNCADWAFLVLPMELGSIAEASAGGWLVPYV
ncbi:MAG: TSUP family transporter, partial [Hydrogenibacillus schlegelii]|nr:TSUP family transporter [Hydrogenibacillus schlegelii]